MPGCGRGGHSSALQAGESIGVAAVTAVMASILVAGSGGQGTYAAVYIALSLLGAATVVIAARSPRVRAGAVPAARV